MLGFAHATIVEAACVHIPVTEAMIDADGAITDADVREQPKPRHRAGPCSGARLTSASTVDSIAAVERARTVQLDTSTTSCQTSPAVDAPAGNLSGICWLMLHFKMIAVFYAIHLGSRPRV